MVSISRHGITSTIIIILRSFKEKTYKQNDKFDEKYNVDTYQIVRIGELDTKSKNWKYANRYQAINSNFNFIEILNPLNIKYEKYDFIDLGSGKGRALLLASRLQFNKIVGVEFSKDLVEISKKNISNYPLELKKCNVIDIVHMDVCEYIFPNAPFVLFMYNPFGKTVLTKVMENMVSSFNANPRNIIIIYVNPTNSEILDKINILEKYEIHSNQNLALYVTKKNK